MNKKQGYLYGQAIIGLLVFLLNYTYFYHYSFGLLTGAGEDWSAAMFLSFTAVLTGMLIELGRFWGSPLEVKINGELLVLQGTPAALLGVIPDPLWLQAGGPVFPYIFFADPVVTGIAGVWLGVVLFRSVFSRKKVKEEEEEREQEQKKLQSQYRQRYPGGI